jgi:hypothetical protein
MESRLLLLLVTPSFVSSITACLGAAIFIIVVNWPYFTYNSAFYPILYGEFGAVTALEQSPALLQGIIEGVSTSPVLYAVLVLTGAAIAGWVVFLFIKGTRASVGSLHNIAERHTAFERAGARILIGILWILFIFISVQTILPFGILVSRIGAESITTVTGILMNIGAFLILAITLHLHILFGRLFLLRPRVFGGKNAIEAANFPLHPTP